MAVCVRSIKGRPARVVFSAHGVNHDDLNIFEQAHGENPILPVTTLHLLEHWVFENLHRIREIDQMLCEIRLPLGFVPLEKYRLAPRGERRTYARNVHT